MTFSWKDPEIKSLLFAYTFLGMLMLGPLAWKVIEPTICDIGADYASESLPDSSLLPLSEPPLWDRILNVATFAGIGGLLGFAFVVSVLFTLLYLPERVWVWSKIYIF